jgi:site-specific recombinase XerD
MRSLRARNVSAATHTTYRAAAAQLTRFLAGRDTTTAAQADRAAVEDSIGSLLETRSAATANNRSRAIQEWFALKARLNAK